MDCDHRAADDASEPVELGDKRSHVLHRVLVAALKLIETVNNHASPLRVSRVLPSRHETVHERLGVQIVAPALKREDGFSVVGVELPGLEDSIAADEE